MGSTVRILLITGSTRHASTNTAALRTVASAPPAATSVELFDSLSTLPHFDPDDDHEPLPPGVAALRVAIGAADVVVFCTPEYAGTLPGSFKNLLDWTVGGVEMSGKPVAWINVAAPTRGEGALAALRVVLGYVAAVILEDCCVSITVARDAVGTDGVVAAAVHDQLVQAVANIAARVRQPPRQAPP